MEKSLTKAQENWGRLGQVLWDGHKPGREGGGVAEGGSGGVGWMVGSFEPDSAGENTHTDSLSKIIKSHSTNRPDCAHRLTAGKHCHAGDDGCWLMEV